MVEFSRKLMGGKGHVEAVCPCCASKLAKDTSRGCESVSPGDRTSLVNAFARSKATCWMIEGRRADSSSPDEDVDAAEPRSGIALDVLGGCWFCATCVGDVEAVAKVVCRLPKMLSNSKASGPTTQRFLRARLSNTDTAACNCLFLRSSSCLSLYTFKRASTNEGSASSVTSPLPSARRFETKPAFDDPDPE